MIQAVLDVGSNSVLTLVAEVEGEHIHPIREISRVSGLGIGTKTSGRLSESSIRATLEAVAEGFEVARSHGATQIKAGGTMALRIAENAQDFVELCAKQGTPVEIISGNEEARLGFLSVAHDPLFANESTLTMIDPGGHSTELVTASRTPAGWNETLRVSVPVGALGLREGILAPETCDFTRVLQACSEIDALIGLEYRPHSTGRVVNLGATGTNLISIREGYTKWEPEKVHGAVLDYEEISRAHAWMFGMTDAERAALIGIEPGRERTLHIGALILERFLFAVHALETTVSVRGWRYAYLLGL